MEFIAHRGNIKGPNPSEENKPEYINKAIEKGYGVEIDVWKIGDKLFLGHDEPQYEIKGSYLKNPKFWCHAKNIESLEYMLKHNIHCFWHQEDNYTITSKGYIWCYPGKKTPVGSICVMPEKYNTEKYDMCYGVCSDFEQK